MPAVQIALRTNVNHQGSLVQMMLRTNQLIYELTDEEPFVSLLYGTPDIASRHLCYINEGHQPPLLWRGFSREAVWLEAGDPVMGKEFSRDRLLAVVASHSEASAQHLARTIYTSVVDFSGTERPEDDVTIATLKVETDRRLSQSGA